jgi:dGTPase
MMDRKEIAKLSHIVINTLVGDIVTASKANMETISTEAEEKDISSENFFMNYESKGFSIEKDKIINFSGKIKKDSFEELISESVHHSRDVERMNEKGKYIIRKLFEAYFAHPQQLPDGPILHLLVETAGKDSEYSNIDKVKKLGIGVARSKFNKILENANVRVQSLLMRRICDHIASMTDHYAIEEYNNLYG